MQATAKQKTSIIKFSEFLKWTIKNNWAGVRSFYRLRFRLRWSRRAFRCSSVGFSSSASKSFFTYFGFQIVLIELTVSCWQVALTGFDLKTDLNIRDTVFDKHIWNDFQRPLVTLSWDFHVLKDRLNELYNGSDEPYEFQVQVYNLALR